jgi:hypothetical protein
VGIILEYQSVRIGKAWGFCDGCGNQADLMMIEELVGLCKTCEKELLQTLIDRDKSN